MRAAFVGRFPPRPVIRRGFLALAVVLAAFLPVAGAAAEIPVSRFFKQQRRCGAYLRRRPPDALFVGLVDAGGNQNRSFIFRKCRAVALDRGQGQSRSP